MATNRKPEYRSYQLTINIEPSLFNMVQSILEGENMTASDYGRGLIVWDLAAKGLITKEELIRICIMGKATNGAMQERLPIEA